MAVSIPPATFRFYRQPRDPKKAVVSTLKFSSISLAQFPSKQRYKFLVQSSVEATEESNVDLEDIVGTSKVVPYSLISTSNVEKILRGIAITDADHYGRLGITRGCSYDQVPVAYKSKCEELMNQELEEDELTQKQELLKESYYILSSEEQRRLYDWSLASMGKADALYQWPFESDISQAKAFCPEDPPAQEPEDTGPTRLVGYFMLGWLILGAVSTLVLNSLNR